MALPAVLYQSGNHAGLPAASSGCVLYTCTDHNKVYRSDGSSWSDWLSLVSGLSNPMTTTGDTLHSSDGSGTPARLAIGSQGSTYRAGATVPEWQKNNLAATAAPGASDDNTAGYSVGSAWFDTTNDEVYFCIDSSTGAAVWKQVGSGSGSSSHHGAQVTKNSGAQALTTATQTKITFDNAVYDTDSYFSDANDYFVIPTGLAGYYQAQAQPSFASNTTGTRGASVVVNGSTYVCSLTLAPVAGYFYMQATAYMYLSEGDTVQMNAVQSSGGNLDAMDGDRCRFTLAFLGA